MLKNKIISNLSKAKECQIAQCEKEEKSVRENYEEEAQKYSKTLASKIYFFLLNVLSKLKIHVQ